MEALASQSDGSHCLGAMEGKLAEPLVDSIQAPASGITAEEEPLFLRQHCDLPERHYRHRHLADDPSLVDHVVDCRAEPRVVLKHPEERVGVEEQHQAMPYASRPRSSFASHSTHSSAVDEIMSSLSTMINDSLQAPRMEVCAARVPTGTSLAMGRPCLVIVTRRFRCTRRAGNDDSACRRANAVHLVGTVTSVESTRWRFGLPGCAFGVLANGRFA